MTEQRTADEIRAYCEAATGGEWYFSEGTSKTSEILTRLKVDRLALIYAIEDPLVSIYDVMFCVNARTDLPRVLEAAVTERDVLVVLVKAAGLISRKLSSNRPVTNLDVMVLDDARWAAGTVIDETAWLEEDTDGSS